MEESLEETIIKTAKGQIEGCLAAKSYAEQDPEGREPLLNMANFWLGFLQNAYDDAGETKVQILKIMEGYDGGGDIEEEVLEGVEEEVLEGVEEEVLEGVEEEVSEEVEQESTPGIEDLSISVTKQPPIEDEYTNSGNVDFRPPLIEGVDLEFFKTEEENLQQDVKKAILDSSNIFAQDKWWEDEKLLDNVVKDLSTALLG